MSVANPSVCETYEQTNSNRGLHFKKADNEIENGRRGDRPVNGWEPVAEPSFNEGKVPASKHARESILGRGDSKEKGFGG